MTDYGRGPGSEPWHPEDPLYGDQGWREQQAADGQAPYGNQPQQQQHYPQQPPQAQQTQHGVGQGPYQQYPPQQYPPQYDASQQQGPQQYNPQQDGQPQSQPQYGGPQQGGAPQYGPQDTGQQTQQSQGYSGPQQHSGPQQYNPQQNGPQQNGPQQYGGPQQDGRPPYDPQQYQEPQQYNDPQYNDPQYNGGWDTGQRAAIPYGGSSAVPYGVQQGGDYAENPDYYSTPEAYPPPGLRGTGPEPEPKPQAAPRTHPGPRAAAGTQPQNEWDAEPPEETHPFFTGRDDDGAEDPGRDVNRRGDSGHDDRDEEDDPGGNGPERRGKTKKKGRSGRACLVLAVVLVGGVSGAGYVGYQFWESRFGPAPDYVGAGSSPVEVVIPDGAAGTEIAGILVTNGVVKSQGAFVAAQNKNPKGNTIQAGVYTLKKQMSGAKALELMLSPSSHNALVIPPGTRNAAVYADIDKRLNLKAGTTEGVAKQQAKNLGLPAWADDNADINDPLEGFLYPSSYPVAQGTKPADVLKEMVSRANAEYAKQDLKAQATELGLKSPLQLITVASLVQAEGMTQQDFTKMAAVVYNRLKPGNTVTNQKLEFDSTYNYAKKQSKINISTREIRNFDDPYNTYFYKGLPPGPIGNPGEQALNAALKPDAGGWLFFISIDGRTTTFTKTLAEHDKLVNEFNKQQKNDQ
jgi:UPF0755 protein